LVLGKLHNGPFLGIFRGVLDFFDPKIALEMAHYVVCPQKKKIISRIFKISGALIVIFFPKRSERPFFVLKTNAENKGKQNGAAYFLVP
jgi:hypothetical protein